MNNKSKLISFYYFISIVIFLTGYAFYILIRGFEPIFNIELTQTILFDFPFLIKNSFASFTHVLALSLFCYALVGAKRSFKIGIIVFWSLINISFELLQLSNGTIVSGTFDFYDIVAILFAAMVFYVLTTLLDNKFLLATSHKTRIRKNYSPYSLSFVVLTGLWTMMACGGGDYSTSDYKPDEPVYLSYQELRAPLKIDTQRELKVSGKIYLFNDLLIVSEPNKGVHIYDNTTPANPIHKVFINLPGNLDVAVRNGFLYADSFIDLVVVDINDLNNIYITNRIEDIFPYDPYQVIPQTEQTFYQWDKNKGVIIGVKKPGTDQITQKIFI